MCEELSSVDIVLEQFGGLVKYAAHTFENDVDITLAYEDLQQEGYYYLFRAYNKYRDKNDAELRKLLKTAVFRGMLTLYQHVFSTHRKLSIGMVQFVEEPVEEDSLVGVYVEEVTPRMGNDFGFEVPDILVAVSEQVAVFVRELISPSYAVRQAALKRFERQQLRARCGFIQREPRVVRLPSRAMIADVLGIGADEVRGIAQTVKSVIEDQRLIYSRA